MLERILVGPSGLAVSEAHMPSGGLEQYDLGGVDCPECGNTGYIISADGTALASRECACMKRRRSLRSIRNSEMQDMLSRYTFENYEASDAKRRNIVTLAKTFVRRDTGWFFIAGKSGSGKTHICTAICKAMIERGEEVRYMRWREESVALKTRITEYEEYEERIGKFKTVPVLYIDDFLKGGTSDADIRLAFEIINARYADLRKRTIISSEMSLREIISLDEAIGSRIFERSKDFRIKAPEENYRLRE